jgi:hypothetical protein
MELAKQKSYQRSFELACSEIRGMDPRDRAEQAGAVYDQGAEGKRITLAFFGQTYAVAFPGITVSSPAVKTISLVTRILLLHYLIRADGTPVKGTWVGYKDIPGGLLYAGVFERRVAAPLLTRFGANAKSFREIGALLGEPAGIGDASFTIRVLPRLPLQYVLWEGDAEFPASLQVLFDASVDHYLSLEDTVVVAQMVTGRLLGRASGESS